MTKKTRKDYDYYTMNIPNELRILYEAYILKYPNLGFKNVSQYLLHVLQYKAQEILKENPEFKKIEEITTSTGIFVLQENGTYKKFVNKEKLLKKIDQMWGEKDPE